MENNEPLLNPNDPQPTDNPTPGNEPEPKPQDNPNPEPNPEPNPQPNPEPEPKPAVNPWDTVDQEYREKLSKFKDINSLAKSYIELEKKLGERPKFKLPETDEEKKQLLKALGVPDKPSDYEVIGEGPEVDAYRTKCAELGLSVEQAKGLDKWAHELAEKQEQEIIQLRQKTQENLALKWGEKMKDNLEIARRELKESFSDKFIERYAKTGLLDDQEFILKLHELGMKRANDQIAAPGTLGNAVPRTSAGMPLLNFPSMQQK